ncbi:flavodoxin [Marinisporobacter balticus]|uniref:Flavodoxin n=1 Tax=Marinisporobacter balticus TaxID=2018667 RepID=A0A4V2SCA5_9FIRM|nr:flavodoxin [Marinisporobacter balticus]TCO78650.1 flavodoxin short chain [Marinisporobacter balticus]
MKKVTVIYWSGTGNTKMMAEAVAEGAGSDAKLIDVDSAKKEDIINAQAIALGCPSMGAEVLEEGSMEPFIESISGVISGKPVGLFGSYDWGDGQWMKDWVERMEDCGANVINEGLTVHLTPEDEGLEACRDLGKDLAK